MWPALFRCSFAAVLSAMFLCACAGAESGEERGLFEQVELIRGHTRIELPEHADGPVPAAILFHGCGGLRAVQGNYAEDLLEAGYAVLIVDSHGARGIGRFAAMTQVCAALRLRGQERAADVRAAIELARGEDGIDGERLALIGWSHGGWTLLEALTYAGEGRLPPSIEGTQQPVDALPGVRSAILVYPYCGFPARARGDRLPEGVDVHAILAGRDMIAPIADCRRAVERAADSGRAVDYVVWDDVTHAFDEPNQPPDPRMEYDAQSAARARAHVTDILDRDLTPQG